MKGFHPILINVPPAFIRITLYKGTIYLYEHMVEYVKLNSKRIIVQGIEFSQGMKPGKFRQINAVGRYWGIEMITKKEFLKKDLKFFRRRTNSGMAHVEGIRYYTPGYGRLQQWLEFEKRLKEVENDTENLQ